MNKWFFGVNEKQKERDIKIFCFPYAGAGASMYRTWQNFFSDNIAIFPVQLPGRENRIDEPMITDMDQLTDEILSGISDYLSGEYYFFGHSMGGIISFELISKLAKKAQLIPKLLFLSGSSVHIPHVQPSISSLNDESLIHYLRTHVAPLPEFSNPVFKKTYLPVVRSDYELIEKYQFNGNKISCPIHAYASKMDKMIPSNSTEAMKKYTTNFTIKYFEGNHLYILNHTTEICKDINQVIKE